MSKRFVSLFVMLWFCLPLVAFSQVGEFRGTVKYFIFDDPNRFIDRTTKEWLMVQGGLKSTESFRLLTEKGTLIELSGPVDWSQYVNREVSFRGRILPSKTGTDVLIPSIKTLQALEPPFYDSATTIPPVTQGYMKFLSVVITVQQPGAIQEPPSFMTLEQALAPIFNTERSAKNFFREASGMIYDPNTNEWRGRLELIGRVNRNGGDAVAVTITSAITNCDQQKTQEWVPLVDAQLRLQGIEPNNYHATVFIYDDMPGCNPFSGATFGTIGQLNSRQYIFTQRSTMLSQWAEEVIAHETGHVLALSHSNVYNCSNFTNFPANCEIVEYGDQACIMGSEYMMPNVYQRRRLGWQYQPFKPLLYSGKYEVYSPSIPTVSAAKRLMTCQYCFVPLSGSLVGNSLYYESRVNYGMYDQIVWNSPMLPYNRGVKLIFGSDDLVLFYVKPFLLDVTPLDGTTNNAPLVLNSFTFNGILTQHVSTTSVRSGSGIYVSLP